MEELLEYSIDKQTVVNMYIAIGNEEIPNSGLKPKFTYYLQLKQRKMPRRRVLGEATK